MDECLIDFTIVPDIQLPELQISREGKKQTQGRNETMEWNRSETLALAAAKCVLCQGVGLRQKRQGAPFPCGCVLRTIFRACYARFKECADKSLDLSRVSLEHGSTRDYAGGWGRKNEEYVADFLLVTRRTLTAGEHRVFRYHYLLGADWRLCCRQLRMDKGNFFHAVYRIQHKLGLVFRELEPYPLYPLQDYFTAYTRNKVQPRIVPIRQPLSAISNLIPLKRSA